MFNQYKKFYAFSVAIILVASIYPIYMAFITLSSYLRNGYVSSEDYPRYIIPYAPICIALITVVLIMPVIYRFFKRYCLYASSLLGLLIFFICELGFESIKVVDGGISLPLESWQYSTCIATPQVLRAIGKPIYAANNPEYKLHFYLVSIIIILTVLNLVSGFTKMIKEQDFSKKKPLIVQLIFTVVFIGLCIFACFTAFFRNGTINISPLSATLMSVFFIVYGVTFGTFIGSIFFGKNKFLSVVMPVVFSVATTIAMYVGELILMGGELFRFGSGFFFEPLGSIPFALVDILVIIASGVVTYLVMLLINKKQEESAT